jgi:hypothetical protein
MSYNAFDSVWWHFAFILIAGWLATDIWRFLGVWFGGRLDPDAEILVLVRAVATALVAAVIAKLILFPSGALAASPVGLRIGAAALGFAAYFWLGRRVWLGVLVAEAILVPGMLLLD